MKQYMQDSLALSIDGERIPSVIPPVDTTPSRRKPFRRLLDARTHGIPDVKLCRTCNTVRAAEEFARNASSRDGLNFRCKTCNSAATKARWSRLTPDEKLRFHEKHLQRTYGMTIDERDALLAAQGGVCACCGTDRHGGKNWHVDHDHDTGKIRGILCNDCNLALGRMRDSPAILRAAAEYLERHGK